MQGTIIDDVYWPRLVENKDTLLGCARFASRSLCSLIDADVTRSTCNVTASSAVF